MPPWRAREEENKAGSEGKQQQQLRGWWRLMPAINWRATTALYLPDSDRGERDRRQPGSPAPAGRPRPCPVAPSWACPSCPSHRPIMHHVFVYCSGDRKSVV